jgi:hypothetical protein
MWRLVDIVNRRFGGTYRLQTAATCSTLVPRSLIFLPEDGGDTFLRYVGSLKFSQGRSKVADNARLGAELAETTVKRLLCCRFRRTSKVMRQVYKCWWRIWGEINVFFRFEYHMFYVLYRSVTYVLTVPHISETSAPFHSFHSVSPQTWNRWKIT